MQRVPWFQVSVKTAASSDNIMSSRNEAPSSVAGEYDPKSDPTRKPRKSTDPGWKYGFWPDLQNKDKVECTLCGQVVSGGIKRLKQHWQGHMEMQSYVPRLAVE